MTAPAPTPEQWTELYAAAGMFKEYAPWEWMEDADLFGIVDPHTGETGYCCVIGALGELLGLLVYIGSDGLAFFEGLQSGRINPDDEDIHAMQRCLSISFEDRAMLEKKDLAVIKSLGLKFRGRQAWPCFRSHSPGFLPWFLTGPEADFLSLALRRAIGIAERFKDNPSLLDAPEEGLYLTAYQNKEDNGTWQEAWIRPAPAEKPALDIPVDEVRLARIKATTEKIDDSWEGDFFFAPFIVDEGERPFFPYIALYADQKSGNVLTFRLAPYSDFQKDFQANFLELLEEIKIRPKILSVKRDTVYDFLKPMTDRLGIKLKKTGTLKAADTAKDTLIDHIAHQQ